MSTTTTTTTTAAVPVCPSWCRIAPDAHEPMDLNDGSGFVHRQQTSGQNLPVLVRVEEWQGSDATRPAGIYLEDAGGDDITAEQARAAGLALIAAADLLDGHSRPSCPAWCTSDHTDDGQGQKHGEWCHSVDVLNEDGARVEVVYVETPGRATVQGEDVGVFIDVSSQSETLSAAQALALADAIVRAAGLVAAVG